jgi:hypothetical protein
MRRNAALPLELADAYRKRDDGAHSVHAAGAFVSLK